MNFYSWSFLPSWRDWSDWSIETVLVIAETQEQAQAAALDSVQGAGYDDDDTEEFINYIENNPPTVTPLSLP